MYMIYYTYAKTDQFLKKKNLYLKCNILFLHQIYIIIVIA